MGRGIAYRHAHFMLIDETEDGRTESGWDNDLAQQAAEDLMADAARDFEAEKFDEVVTHPERRDAFFFAGTEKLRLGIDTSGDTPCIFAEALGWSDSEGRGGSYPIDDEVRIGFNKLILRYGPEKFSRPTSAWTSTRLARY